MKSLLCVRFLWGAAVAAGLVFGGAVYPVVVDEERPDILVEDFEGETYGDWEVTGTAFGPGPARGTLPGQMPVTGYKGEGLVNSFFGGDASTGTLTSPPLTIERRKINFLIGGGGYEGKTCINLIVDGEIVRTATGPNVEPGGSERLDWHTWNVAEFEGRQAVIEIVDQATGGWGHINVDHIVQSDRRRQEAPAERALVVERRYLHLPVENGAAMRRMEFRLDEATVREFDIELALDPDEADFWVFADLAPFAGEELVVAVDRLPADSTALAALRQDDEVPGADELYREPLRPQFHFTSRRGWLNDPNGLVYYDGEYHLFYQHNPYGWRWGNMHWGHAVSTDLVHWRELPIALYPQRYGDWCFSGGALVDWDNTAGFQTGEEKVIVATYTSTGRGEALAYSNDRGRTFTDYEGNPVVEHRGRDPKVIWYEPGGHWVMAVYSEIDDEPCIAFYTSADLKGWEYQSHIEGYYECPEIFELAVDGDEAETLWVVYAADGAYALGDFDGSVFTPQHEGKHRFNWGNCFYASQTFSDIPPEDGRRIQIAWGRVAHPGMPFNQMMNFPVVLTLRSTEEGPRLFAEPVEEIALLHETRHAWEDVAVGPENDLLAGIEGELFHVRAEFALGGTERFGFRIRGVPVVYDTGKAALICNDRTAPLAAVEGRIRLELLVDRTSIEVFANDGQVYMPMGMIFPEDDRSLAVFSEGGNATAVSLNVAELRSIWEQ